MSEINVTPLVDVMLVLLIIFMVAAPMITTGVTVDLPNADAPRMELEEERPIIVIQRDGSMLLSEEAITMEGLEARLAQDASLRAQEVVYVQADEEVRYGAVVRVLALLRRYGVTRTGLVTDPTDGENE